MAALYGSHSANSERKCLKVSIIRTVTARLLKCHTGVVLYHHQIASQCIKVLVYYVLGY
jgi:hypothetical protein